MKYILPLLICLFVFATVAFAQGSKVKIDIQKKIADATPAALPQAPTDDRRGTDARDANLKSRVKSVTHRHTDNADRRYPKQLLTGEDFYDEAGNRVRSIDWDDVHPLGVTVYGYLDKMRVSRRGNIEYADCEKPDQNPCVPIMHTLPAPKDAAKGDERYDIRWVYKYDSRGRLAEEVHLSNRGEILTRTTYNYETETRRVVLHYAAGAEPLARVIEIIDPAHGNIVEEWLHDEEQKVNAIRYYSYKFDDRGNWIEQRVTERLPSEKRAKPVATTYRSITYYP